MTFSQQPSQQSSFNSDVYLQGILTKYTPSPDLASAYSLGSNGLEDSLLVEVLKIWGEKCHATVEQSGSVGKGTNITLGSDVDYLVSVCSTCERDAGLQSLYNKLYQYLRDNGSYTNVRKQNVSIGFTYNGKKIDCTPARRWEDGSGDHSIWVNTLETWKKTNIQKHVDDVKFSGRTEIIRLIKVWRKLHGLTFPSIYLEYLVIDVLSNYPFDTRYSGAFLDLLRKIASPLGNPLYKRLVDPANSNNDFDVATLIRT